MNGWNHIYKFYIVSGWLRFCLFNNKFFFIMFILLLPLSLTIDDQIYYEWYQVYDKIY